MNPENENEFENLTSKSPPGLLARIKDIRKTYLILGLLTFSLLFLIPLFMLIVSTLVPSSIKKNLNESSKKYTPGPFVADELIVEYKSSYSEEEVKILKKKLDEIGVVSQEKIFKSDNPKLKNFFLLKFKKGSNVKKITEELSNFKEIESVELNYIFETQVTPNDLRFSEQWDLVKVEALRAWDLQKGSNSVKVAVIDTGIDYNHPDLAGRVVKGPDYSVCDGTYVEGPSGATCTIPKSPDSDPMDDAGGRMSGHGTHVSGTIGAIVNNGIGIAGLNWNVTLLAVKTQGKNGVSDMPEIVQGIEYAADNGANVINMSLAGRPRREETPEGVCRYMSSYQRVIDYALSKGVIVAAAAGNDGQDTSNYVPASCDGVIAVGASNQSDARSIFGGTSPFGGINSSNYGARVDIAAPGTAILSTWPGGNYASHQGTSMAAPHVAGVAALLFAAKPGLSGAQVKDCLVNGADPIFTDRDIGPRLNAYKSLALCLNITPEPPTPTSSIPTPTTPPGSNPTQTPTPTKSVATGKIMGKVYRDDNQNGQRDAGEPGVSDMKITLEGQVPREAFSNASGDVEFRDLPTGRYVASLWISGQKVISTGPMDINANYTYTFEFGIYGVLLTPMPTIPNQPSPTIIIVNPTLLPTPTLSKTTLKPTPTPVKTYICRERAVGIQPPPGTIKMGDLECVLEFP